MHKLLQDYLFDLETELRRPDCLRTDPISITGNSSKQSSSLRTLVWHPLINIPKSATDRHLFALRLPDGLVAKVNNETDRTA
jgi:hypothetical protein